MACLIKKSEASHFVEQIQNNNVDNKKLAVREVNNTYNIFAREYSWSPAYMDWFNVDYFEEVDTILC